MRSHQLSLGLCIVLMLIVQNLARAQSDEVEPAVPALPPLPTILRAVKEPSPAHLRGADQVWQQHQATLSVDMLSRYAMALALAGNNRHAAAFTLMEKTPEVARKAGPLRRLWIWLAVKTKKDDIATHELQTLLIDLGARAAASAAPAANDTEDLQFAAKMVTYLEFIAGREVPLDAAQAKNWWRRLEALPEPWRKDLPELRAALQAEKDKQQQLLQANHGGWLAKTSKDVEEAKAKLDEMAPKEKDVREKLEKITSEYQEFLVKAEPQMETCKLQTAQGQQALKSLREPLEPATFDSKGKRLPNAQQIVNEYRFRLQQYQAAVGQITSVLASLNKQMTELTVQDTNYKRTIAQGQTQLKKLQTPLQNMQKEHERLQKSLADNATWDSPASLERLRALELYQLISLTAEAERIERKRN